MAITVVQTSFAQGTIAQPSSLSPVFASNVTAGNCVIAVISFAGATSPISTVKTGTNADNWANGITVNSGSTIGTAIWIDPNSAGGSNTIAVTATGSNLQYVYTYEVSGIITSSPTDKTSTATGTGTSWTSNTTATTTQASEIWIGGVTVAINATQTGPTSPWTNETAANNTNYTGSAISGYQIVSTTGTATYAGTSGSSGTYAGAVIALKALVATTTTAQMFAVF